MEHLGSIAQMLHGRTILVVGATGFLAKVFVEKILRSQPKVGKIYLLLRARNTELALNRFENEIMKKELFRVLREREGANFDSFIKSRVQLIPGDISEDELGINEDSNLKEELWRQVQVVVNFAATTNFSERYDIALRANTFGALQAYNFARRCTQIKLFLHVSTAYVSGGDGGLVLERPFQINEIGSGRF